MYINQENIENSIDQLVEEGVNKDIVDIYFTSKLGLEVRAIKKEYRTALKENDFTKAYKAVDDLEKILKENKAKMEKIPADSLTSNIIGNFAALLISYIEVILVPSLLRKLSYKGMSVGWWNDSFYLAVGLHYCIALH